jgi:hypothetical protein
MLLGIFVLGCPAIARSADPPTKRQAQKYRALVEQLASPNKEATTHVNGDPEKVIFPKDYDVQAQKSVGAARAELHQNFAEALPYLIDGLEDKRYSMTVSIVDGEAYYNYSVGQICRELICLELEVYRDSFIFTKQEYHAFNYPISKEWYSTRTKKTVPELQIEAIDWAITKGRGGRRSDQFDQSESFARLQKLRAEIVKTGTPAKRHARLKPMVTGDR